MSTRSDLELMVWALSHGYIVQRMPDWETDAPSRWQWLGPWANERYNHMTAGQKGSDLPNLDDEIRLHLEAERRKDAFLDSLGPIGMP